MENKKISITVGIPAYNEEKNIVTVITSLLKQKGVTLERVIVASDGSTDNTVPLVNALAKKLRDSRITVIDDKKRKGKSTRLEEIMKAFSSDILIFIDADITITDPYLFSKIVEGFSLVSTGILAVNATPLPARNFIEACINHSVKIQQIIRKKWNNGNNYLSFGGRLLVLSKTLAKKVHIPAKMINHDAFLYFEALRQGYTPVYLADCSIYYRSPSTFHDHMKQSLRFQTQQRELNPHNRKVVAALYRMPLGLFMFSVVVVFLLNPIYFISYAFMSLYISRQKHIHVSNTWDVAQSTK